MNTVLQILTLLAALAAAAGAWLTYMALERSRRRPGAADEPATALDQTEPDEVPGVTEAPPAARPDSFSDLSSASGSGGETWGASGTDASPPTSDAGAWRETGDASAEAAAYAPADEAAPAAEGPPPTDDRGEALPEEPVPAGGPATSFEDEPEETPFERDGRWWFKRGGELLVYEEQSGQWVPAPPSNAQVLAPAAVGSAVSDSGSEAGDAGAPEQGLPAQDPDPEPEPVPASSSFWKCPSCGAVNGSTATSCRMCFAPRA